MLNQKIVVRKFGGAGLATIEKVKAVAAALKSLHQQGQSVIAVVSAMGTTTDQLIQKAYEISPHPDRRELDMLISTGERVSMSLLTMALKDIGCNAISFTGSQAGVLTDGSHSNARILEVRPQRVAEALGQGKIVVVAGFQGVDPVSKEITTLGRGGTDTTAVAFAAHFKAARCEIVKEVDGIFTADPKQFSSAQLITEVNYDTLLHMCQWGAKALHFRSVELAKQLNVPIWVGSFEKMNQGTLCHDKGHAVGLNVLKQVFYTEFKSDSSFREDLKTAFAEQNWQEPTELCTESLKDSQRQWYSSSPQIYETCQMLIKHLKGGQISDFPMTAYTISGRKNCDFVRGSDYQIASPEGTSYIFKNAPTSQTIETWVEQLASD